MAKLRKITIGTRSSKLSVIQSDIVRDLILKNNNLYRDNSAFIEIRSFTTQADKLIDRSLSEIGGKGLFTKEIENSLLNSSIDIAVHSIDRKSVV